MGGTFRYLGLLVGSLPVLAMALGKIQVETAVVGQKTLVITVDDSILTPDLGKLQIEGYEIENAVFLDEKEDSPIQFMPGYLDMTAPGNGRILEFLPSPGVVILDAPVDHVPQVGGILADTAFGGLLRRIVKVEGQPQAGSIGRRWTLTTVEAELGEAIRNVDMTFTTRLDLNHAIPDVDRVDEVMGYLPDGSSNYADAEYTLRDAQILFQPTVTGRIRIANGKVEDFAFYVKGECEVMADARGAFHGRGEYEYEDELPSRAPLVLPLGNGLFLRAQNRPFFRMEAEAHGEGFTAHADFRISNSIRGELAYSKGQWRPMAENRMSFSNKSVQELWGDGHLVMSLKPRVDFLIAGVQGPAFTFEPYARFTANKDSKSWTYRTDAREQALKAADPQSGALKDMTLLSNGNKELSLGANIFMETRTTFSGPPLLRNFVLFNREQTVLSPPREGNLSIKEADSGRILLLPQTFPKADRYIIQQKVGLGAWEIVSEQPSLLRIRLGNLKPGTQYRFRAIGINSMGMGPAFPAEGVVFITPALNHPPLVPYDIFPDSGAVVPNAAPVLTWRGGDSDPGGKVLYTVYLDNRFPPLATRAYGITDTTLGLSDLKPGVTYFWKVVASDGKESSEGPVRAFTVKALPESVQPVKPQGYPMVAVPKGSFHRDDGKEIQVGPFLMGRYEVSQSEFERTMGRNPSYRLQDSLPVERVTWEEAETFCQEMGGRLPTEAEWEYAARAGSSTQFYWGSGNPADYAWFRENSEDRTQKVGQKKPNGWGLHDMAGNVFEWTRDWYGDYSAVSLDHPRGPETGVAKVIRGASWYSESDNLGLGSRYNNRPAFRNFKVGFRCVKDTDPMSAVPASGSSSLASKLQGSPGPVLAVPSSESPVH